MSTKRTLLALSSPNGLKTYRICGTRMLRQQVWFVDEALWYTKARNRIKQLDFKSYKQKACIFVPHKASTREFCAICYMVYGADNDTYVMPTRCGHHFCLKCMNTYVNTCINTSNPLSCPLCTQSMFDSVHTLQDALQADDVDFARTLPFGSYVSDFHPDGVKICKPSRS
jgi:hypothetical protein